MQARDDNVRFARPSRLPGLELVEASYTSRAFPVHSHEEYVIGVMVAGAERLSVGGRDYVARAGDLILLRPGEAHANLSMEEEGLAYCVFYVPLVMVTDAFGPVFFREPVLPGGQIATEAERVHRQLGGGDDDLEAEADFYRLLECIFEFAGNPAPQVCEAPRAQIALARTYLDAHFAERVSLTELSQVAGLSPYHFLRSFRDQVGLTPGAYQTQLRIHEARRRLRDGQAIADIAMDLGFADQSHLTRHFQRIIGTSPGRYAQQ